MKFTGSNLVHSKRHESNKLQMKNLRKPITPSKLEIYKEGKRFDEATIPWCTPSDTNVARIVAPLLPHSRRIYLDKQHICHHLLVLLADISSIADSRLSLSPSNLYFLKIDDSKFVSQRMGLLHACTWVFHLNYSSLFLE